MTVTDFRVLAFFAADHAQAVGGKVYVNGGFWNRLRFPTYPAIVPSLSLVAVLEVPYRAYHQDHSFRLGMEDTDRNVLPLEATGSFRVGAEPGLRVGDPTLMPIAIPITGLRIDKPGDYAFTLSIDGAELERYRVRAVHTAVPMKLEFADPDAPSDEEA
jgi:hypothetical protein